MTPLRMCMVCRKRQEKSALVRVVKTPEGRICPDPTGKLSGRGAYFCKDRTCLEQAGKRRTLERAFSCKVEAEVYQNLLAMAEVTDDES